MTEGCWLLPTKGRPEKVARFFEQWRKTAAHTPGILIVNADDDHDYREVPLPSNWLIETVSASCVADAVNTAWMTVADKDWIGLLCDDLWPETMEWDEKLISLSKPDHLVASANGSQEQRLHGALVYGGELLRHVGWMYPPGVKHSFHDDAWEEIGRQCRNIIKASDVMVRHVHEGTVDETGRKRNSYWNEDEKAYRVWRASEASSTIKKVVDLMRESGSLGDKPDLGDRSLMIVSPNYDSKFEREFLFSLEKTRDMFRAMDIKVDFNDCPGVAEPGYARALIHGAFYRSPFTDLAMVDSDMGWEPRDLLRLMSSGFDLVAAAGPRKLDRPAYAAHITREDADAMYVDEKTGAMGVSQVGAAFMLIRRLCAERMVAAYGDLAFDTDHGSVEHDLFQNLIVPQDGKRRRLSEDYAYCWRARRIGIRTMVVPDIRLQHVGRKVWEGSLSELLKPQAIAAE